MTGCGSLSVAMIVRNEEATLPGCLESLTFLGDSLAQVCIYDTGSTDATVDIARQWGAKVERGFWDDDFARARNCALAQVRTRWALIVDADDRVTARPDDVRTVLRTLESRADGADVAGVVTVADSRGGVIIGRTPSVRLLQPGTAHYRRRLHENVFLRRTGAEPPMVVVPADALSLTHVGYGLAETLPARAERNARIARLELADARRSAELPRVVAALVNRGRGRAEAGDAPGAQRDWAEAFALESGSAMGLLAGELLAFSLIDSGEPARALDIAQALERGEPDPGMLALIRGKALDALGKHREALAALQVARAPRSASGQVADPGVVLSLRAQVALKAGADAEALAALLGLLEFASAPEVIGPLLRLWGERPLESLGELLVRLYPDRAADLAGDFASAGVRGQAVAAALRRTGS